MGEKMIPRLEMQAYFLARFCAAVHTLDFAPGRSMGMGMSKVKVKVACSSHLAPSSVVSELGIA